MTTIRSVDPDNLAMRCARCRHADVRQTAVTPILECQHPDHPQVVNPTEVCDDFLEAPPPKWEER